VNFHIYFSFLLLTNLLTILQFIEIVEALARSRIQERPNKQLSLSVVCLMCKESRNKVYCSFLHSLVRLSPVIWANTTPMLGLEFCGLSSWGMSLGGFGHFCSSLFKYKC
jgi:hypothetical protein